MIVEKIVTAILMTLFYVLLWQQLLWFSESEWICDRKNEFLDSLSHTRIMGSYCRDIYEMQPRVF